MNREKLPAHAPYSPSSMHRIIECPLSVKLAAAAPRQKESEYAAEGTFAHGKGEEWLIEQEMPDFEGNEEMQAAVKVYVDYCDPLIDAAERYGIEAKAVADEELFGTIDCWVVKDGTLEVIDFKYGAGVMVSPEENKQQLTYAALLFLDDELNFHELNIDSVKLTIVQPRGPGDSIKSWGCDVPRVDDHLKEIDGAINASKMVNPPGAMGDHCRFCPAKITCPVLTAAESGLIEFDHASSSPVELAEMLKTAQVLEDKAKAMFHYAHSIMEDGVAVPGWKLVPKRATKKWTDQAAVIKWAKRNGKLTKMFKKTLCSPAQANTILGDDFDSVSQFIDAVSSGTNVKRVEDPTEEAVSLGQALNAIGSLPQR